MSDSASLTVPEAGWYPDRSDPRVTRWWDGQQWTDHTRELANAVDPSVVQPVSAAAFGLGAAATPVAVAATAVAPVAPVAASVPAGWYPDNADLGLQRWWDGQQWTQHTAPIAAPASPSATSTSAYQPEPSYSLASGSVTGGRPLTYAVNSLATRGMIYSLIALVLNPLFIMSIGGFVNGIRSLRRAPNFMPANARRGQAIAAIVIGAIATLFSIGAIVSAVQVYMATHAGS